MIEKLRVYSSLGVIAGQFVLLFNSKPLGLCILILCSTMSLPYFINKKYYDIVLLILVGMGINLAGLILSR
jgi:hypothetical protein